MQSTCYPTNDCSRTTDRDLIESARGGDTVGFEQLIERYSHRLHLSMLAVIGCPDLAEDIVQEAFVRAFRFINTFQGRSNFYTWLFRIALNCRRAYFKKRLATIQLDLEGQNATEAWAQTHDSPIENIERTEVQIEVRKSMARLNEKYLTILVLREFDELDYRDIGEVLNLNLGTVRSRLSRARAALKKELKPYFDSTAN